MSSCMTTVLGDLFAWGSVCVEGEPEICRTGLIRLHWRSRKHFEGSVVREHGTELRKLDR